jgi:site-specific recombinase XerD
MTQLERIIVTPPAAAVDYAAVDRLPGTSATDPFWRLLAAFREAYPDTTARAYVSDLTAWSSWCDALGAHPFTARRHHVDAWIRHLTTQPLPRTGRPAAAATVARKLSAVSKFYGYAIEAEVVVYSPVDHVLRPKVPKESSTVGLSADEMRRLLAVAEAHSPRSAALIGLLTLNGLRISEALGTDVRDYSHDRGHRVLRITRKGGDVGRVPLAALDGRGGPAAGWAPTRCG